ncbi:Lysophosphatidic acid acyltransferase LPAAT [Trachipleistophora hominis]|uniref:Lysophosphatidic acid acyltransferase LPAAT n=1 Tax=Trachipleistophora hominis TaxID=72359 RepID=L7K095_TRAHO|nr:Lysophosphatidic acid acyltransferase LPAAT [Trachipleistophora hominis]
MLWTKIYCFAKICSIAIFYFTLSFYVGTLLLLIRLVLRPFKNARSRFTKIIKGYWLSLTASVCYFYFPHPIYVAYNKEILKKKRCLIVSNHLTNLDWIFIVVILNELGMYEELCIIMKYSLSKLPIYGYGMKCFDYIFLKRRWQEDIHILSQGLEKMKKKENFYLLFFPEGTILDSETYEKSQKYGRDLNMTIDGRLYNPQFCLIPRVKGINKIYEVLQEEIDGVIDITLFITPYKRYLAEYYDYCDVLFNLQRIPRFYIVLDEYKGKMNGEWLHRIFDKKDKCLRGVVTRSTSVENITCLADFAKLFGGLYQKKFNYFGKTMWSNNFYLNLCAFFIICASNIYLLKKLFF